jgi:hypothetical protein
MRHLLAFALLLGSCAGQSNLPLMGVGSTAAGGFVAISVEATCSGTGSTQTVACSAPMSVTAGDLIECSGSTVGFDPMMIYFNDIVNGPYDNIVAEIHPNAANTWVATAVLQNSAGGSITPQVNNWEGNSALNLKCRALKGVRTSLALDGGAVNQTKSQSTTATNPTSGTAAAPTNNNEIVIGAMVRPTTTATTDAAPWVPGGTITAVGSNYPIYDQYSIQTTATAANSPMTAATAKYIDSQFAVLHSANPAGYRSLTGFLTPAIAKTNGASVTAADLSGATTTLSSMNASTSPMWTLTGTAATYTTAVAPTGTGKIMVQAVPHTFGDAGTSINFGALTATFYSGFLKGSMTGQAIYGSAFIRVGATGAAFNTFCDVMRVYGGIPDYMVNLQIQYDATNAVSFLLEPSQTSTFNQRIGGFALDTDYWVQTKLPSVNEQYYQALVYTKAASTWSLASTLNMDELCGISGNCDTAGFTPTASTTGTASSGSTALTVASGTGIVLGQEVRGTGIPYLTTVAAVAGTAVTLSQKTTGALSGTAVTFFNPSPLLVSATNGTGSAGSTALTIVAPGSGVIAIGNNVGGTGIVPGTYVTAVTGTSVTLSQPTSAALSSGGVTFWSVASSTPGLDIGKFSSCTMTNSISQSGIVLDPTAAWGAFAPN